MKKSVKLISTSLLAVLLAGQWLTAAAQEFTPLPLEGLNADCVFQRGETRATHVSLDQGNWIYYAKNVKSSGGLPAEFTSTLFGVPYKLAAFDGPNVLMLNTGTSKYKSGKLTFAEQVQGDYLFIVGMSADGEKHITTTLNYSDGTSESSLISFHDWFGGQDGSALWKLGRMDKTSGSYDGRLEFGLFEAVLPLDRTKTLVSLSCQAGDGNTSFSSIFAVTAATGYTFSDAGPVFIVTDAHLDTQWNWDVKETIERYIANTLTGNFARIDKYPHFRFNFEGAQKYAWMKEYYPSDWERLKQYVADGRWNPSGGSWDACEVMVSSAESLLRNLLYGQTFYKREFGKKGGLDIMLPDCFGFPASLPSIAAHCGFIGFHTQKLGWGSAYPYDALPTFGKWRGVDGNEIYCILKMGEYTKQWKQNLAYNTDLLGGIIGNEKNFGLRANFRYTGTGDTGGALGDTEVSWLEKSATSEGPVKVHIVSPTECFEYMAANDKGQYKVVDHELPLTSHGVGCYTSQTMMKYWNRRNELTADAAERSSVAAAWLGGFSYPYQTLTTAWHRFLWHQFHDDLTGTCIPRAYGYSRNDEVMSLMDFQRVEESSVAAVAQQMDTRVGPMPVVVYNPLSIPREDIVEGEVPADEAWTAIRVTDAEGQEVPAQLTGFSEGCQHFIFAARVPSMGFATYSIQKDAGCTIVPDDFSIGDGVMENAKYRVTIDTSTGEIRSIYDKTLSQELLSAPLRLALLKCRSTEWPAWEIPYSVTKGSSTYVNNNDGTLSVTVAEDGPLRKAFRIERTRLGSTFVQYVRLTSAGSSERVDVWNETDWQSRGYLLKLEANLRCSNAKATYDNSLGFLTRGLSTESYFEYCGHQWADQTSTDGRFGVSILNDCKYGWDKPSNSRLRMSIVYSPEVGTSYPYQANQDLGLQRYVFSLFSHSGQVGEETQWQSDRLNQPLVAYIATPHEGLLGTEFSFLQVDNTGVAVRALKRAEESECVVVRFHEITGNAQDSVSVTFPADIVAADETNGIEEPIGSASFEGRTLTFSIGAFGIKTFALRLAAPREDIVAATAPDTSSVRPVSLTYNADMMSLNANRADGLSTLGSLFPGELLPDTLLADGIPFLIGPRTAGKKNVVQCKGQEIALDYADDNDTAQSANDSAQGDSVTLHLLAFSIQPEGADLTLRTDEGTELPLRVGYAKGNIADWGGFYSASMLRNENVAFTATHSHEVGTKKDVAYDYMYFFHYTVRVPASCRTLTLPSQQRTFIVALTREDNPVAPLTPLRSADELFPTPREVTADAVTCGTRLMPPSVTASDYASSSEAPRFAADGNAYTMWSDSKSTTKWLLYTFPEDVGVCQWEVILGGIDGQANIASAFTLQYYDAQTGRFTDCDQVTHNAHNHLVRGITPVISRRFRLMLDSPVQSGSGTARVCQFNLFGTDNPEPDAVRPVRLDLTDGPQPVYDAAGRTVGTATVHNGLLCLPPLPAGIYVVASRKVRVS
ncbi:MAG: alpha-mannosidase [Bacteroidaceae bacterium]|nr:alpha-mannosidase [Bacteroidaceae bacterium]